ncbi:MAG: phosphoribosylglycinamide formyltransferase [Firmicutes bacterium HGW-Firmicutes-20]|jgi:phosphoribosylglycinamide formyltransferase-1|nr:MAG: phosphoribosylglycinamide formyltransferase [Firmicutes bacterium HGW-Firmicutes-20]PKM86839.1 MAG: phosphoribosylglycinamide formyltransferase [Firmicutes bacterium HGW-Firmicutes-10]
MKNIVVFASGFGSNFQAIIDAVKHGKLHANIVGLICDKPGAYAIERARINGIPVALFERNTFSSKAYMDRAILNQCESWQADWLILAGYMRLLSPLLIQAYPRHIVNIHPSLLPKYRGLDAVGQALNQQERIYGLTIHYVDEGMDTGDIIVQVPFEVDALDRDHIEKRLHALEHVTYPAIINKLIVEECV